MHMRAPHRYPAKGLDQGGEWMSPQMLASSATSASWIAKHMPVQASTPASGTRHSNKPMLHASANCRLLNGSRSSFPASELEPRMQLLVFPLAECTGTRVPASVPRVVGPTAQTLAAMRVVLRRAFGHESVVSLTQSGWACVLLVEERKRDAQRGHGTRQNTAPFSKLVAACVFDIKGGDSKLKMHVPLFATEESCGGRGFAKLLFAHLRVLAASIAEESEKEIVLILPSLPHAVAFWTSESLGLTTQLTVTQHGGKAASSRRTLPQCSGTTDCFLTVRTEEVQRMEVLRGLCIVSVHEKSLVASSELRTFPRLQRANGAARSSSAAAAASAATSESNSDAESEHGSGSDGDEEESAEVAPEEDADEADSPKQSSARKRRLSQQEKEQEEEEEASPADEASSSSSSNGGSAAKPSRKKGRTERVQPPRVKGGDRADVASTDKAVAKAVPSSFCFSFAGPTASDAESSSSAVWQRVHDAPLRAVSMREPPSSELECFLRRAARTPPSGLPLWGHPPVQRMHLHARELVDQQCVAAMQEGTAEQPPKEGEATFTLEKVRLEHRAGKPKLNVPLGYCYKMSKEGGKDR